MQTEKKILEDWKKNICLANILGSSFLSIVSLTKKAKHVFKFWIKFVSKNLDLNMFFFLFRFRAEFRY